MNEEDPDSINPFRDLEDLGVIGRGQYSVVHKVRRNRDGLLLAVKRVQNIVHGMDSGEAASSSHQAMNEARLLGTLRHPHIVTYHSSHLISGDLYLILELAQGGDLGSVISQAIAARKSLTEEQVWRLFTQVASAVAFMHQSRILHRDIKPSNVFLTGESSATTAGPVLKVGDLGLSRCMSSRTLETFSEVGSPFYMSPEAVSNSGYSFASDTWSLGVLLYELSMLKSPFYEREINLYTLGNRIQQCQYEPLPSTYSQSLRQLVACILVVEADRRPSAQQVLELAQLACRSFDHGVAPDVSLDQLEVLVQHLTLKKSVNKAQEQISISVRRGASPRTSPRTSPTPRRVAAAPIVEPVPHRPRRSPRTDARQLQSNSNRIQ